MNKSVLITGGTGFVGSELVKNLLSLDWKIALVVRESSSLGLISEFINRIHIIVHSEDQKLIDDVGKFNPLIVIHLAAYYTTEHKLSDIDSLIESNINFGVKVLEAVVKNEIENFINIGTSWQHYNNQEYNPVNLYAATKQAYTDILKYYIDFYHLNCITLKLFDTYGETDKRGKLINYISTNYKSNILELSEGYQKIDLVHVDDVCNAIIVGMERLISSERKKRYEEFAVATKQPVTLRELIEMYSKVLDYELKVNWGAKKYRDREVMKLWTNYEILPNWEPKVTLEDGIKRIVRHKIKD